jgi:hypothetical protein
MKKIVFVFMCLLSILPVLGLEITEVFPNPVGSDNNKEFVEVYHEGSLNLEGFILGDIKSNDTLVLLQNGTGEHSIIVEEGYIFDGIAASVYSIGATIGNSLGNGEDAVFLYDVDGVLIDSFFYYDTTDGYSWEKNGSTWIKSDVVNGTPGYANSRSDSIEEVVEEIGKDKIGEIIEPENLSDESSILINVVSLSSLLPEIFYLNQSMTKGFRIDNEATGKIDVDLDVTVFYESLLVMNTTKQFFNISRYKTKDTLDIFFTETGNYTICGFIQSNRVEENFSDNKICANVTVIDLSSVSCDRYIGLDISGDMFKNREKIPITPIVRGDYEDIPFVLSYWVEELTGEVVKKARNSSSKGRKSWTPKITKPYGVYVVSAALLDPLCNDTNLDNNVVKEHVIVTSTQAETGGIAIEHIYKGSDGVVKTGEVVRAKVHYYSGNLSGLAADEKKLSAFVKDKNGRVVSEKTTFGTTDSFSSGEIILPVLLDYSCKDFPTNSIYYTLIVQGFGSSSKEKFAVMGVDKDLCSSGISGEYHSLVFPQFGYNNSNVTSSVTIHNIDTKPHEYKVSSKVYRGPKTHSGDHFVNQKSIVLNPGVVKKINLVSELDNIEEGDYKIKIRVERDNRKTPKEFRDDFTVVGTLQNVGLSEDAAIVSFGSWSTEVDEDVILYSVIEGSGNYTLVFDGPYDRENRTIFINGTTQQVFNTSLQQGKNNLVLRLMDATEVISSEPLILYTANYEIEDVTAAETVITPIQNSGFGAVTGAVIGPATSYEGTFYRIKNGLNYFLIALLLSFNVFLLFQRE